MTEVSFTLLVVKFIFLCCALHCHNWLTSCNVGAAGVSFETSSSALIDQIPSALGVFAEAVEKFIKIPAYQV